jgi:hypothetical protein
MTVRDTVPTFAPICRVRKRVRGTVAARLDAVAA